MSKYLDDFKKFKKEVEKAYLNLSGKTAHLVVASPIDKKREVTLILKID